MTRDFDSQGYDVAVELGAFESGGVELDRVVSGAIGTTGPAAVGSSGPVKLVIWDLDETLWAGTLSEGPVRLDQSRVDLVRSLNRRGIINAICSKNDTGAAQARLEAAGCWSEFVFARIDWSPKGPRVARIVEDAQLRPESVLFIDDLPLNRAEVGHFVPGIRTAGPEILDQLLSLPELAGKDDSNLSRLRQYRMLEKKLVDRESTPETNDEFLRSCDIRLGVYYDAEAETERLFELLSRTHQLNFTKRRSGREQFEAMLADPDRETGYVRICDRYGDYGICGFYSLSADRRTLEDFLFSCRVLGMGVEQWMYDYLGRPALSVVGEISSSLETDVDWITLDIDGCDAARGSQARPGPSGRAAADQGDRFLMIGGCDLNTTAQFLGGRIRTEFAHTASSGAFVHVGHTELLRQSASALSEEQWELIRRIPFTDEEALRSSVLGGGYDVLVHSVLTDYTQGLYRHRRTGLVVPWYQLHLDVTDPAVWPWVEARYWRDGVDREFLMWFADEFEPLGGISPGAFQENLRWLATSIPASAQVVFLNGAEVPLDDEREPDRHLRHREMNDALDEVVATLPNAAVCDVRTFVLSKDDLRDNLRHYRRHAYVRMAEEIRTLTSPGIRVQRHGPIRRSYDAAYRFAGRRRVQARRLKKRLRRAS